jgi:hypothetical protein
MKKYLLRDRIDFLLAILDAKDDPSYQEFAKLLRAVQKLAEQRNLIAHNSLGIDVYVDANTGGMMLLNLPLAHPRLHRLAAAHQEGERL